MSVSCILEDICAVEYLADHHNRDGEVLIAVEIDSTTATGDIAIALSDEIDSLSESRGLDYAEMQAAVAKWAEPYTGNETFCASLEGTTTAWFLFKQT